MSRISKRLVDNVAPGEKDGFLWDSELPGFGVKITPAGRKVYIIQYRLGGRKGKTRRYTLGRHGVITSEQARIEAKRLLGEVSAGRDPAEEKSRKRAMLGLHELLKVFLSEHADTKLKPDTAAAYRRIVDLHVITKMKSAPIDEVQRSDVARLHHALRAEPYLANRTLALLSKFFNWCEQNGYRANNSNPCRHIEKFREQKRERFLSHQELRRLGDAINKAEQEGLPDQNGQIWIPSVYVPAAIRLLVLTGARLSEILTLKWDYVDCDRAVVRLPDSKTGAKNIYLNAPALSVLNALPRMDDNPYVICGEREGAHLVNLQKPWRRIRHAAQLDDVRIHDLRHSFASVAAGAGMSLPVIGALLGHSQPGTTARYAHLSENPVQGASESIAKFIDDALRGDAADNIIQLRKS